MALDSSQSDRFHGRRRSRSADSATKDDERKDKEIFRKLAAEQASNNQAPSTQSQSPAPAQNSFQLEWDGQNPHEVASSNARPKGTGSQAARNNKSSSDAHSSANKSAGHTNSRAAASPSKKSTSARKPAASAKDSCRDSAPQSNRSNRRYDDDERGPGAKPGWNYGGGSNRDSRPWRQGSSGQGSRQGGGTNNGKHSDSNEPLV